MKKNLKTFVLSILLLQCCFMGGCASGTIITEINDDMHLCMEVSDYTNSLERTITIKNTQSGRFSVQLSPSAGKITISIKEAYGDTILTINENATLFGKAAITQVTNGNGTYKVIVQADDYTGSFDIIWEVV